jgi:Arc/MetJ-type ribon-helix-helix transcriptional regulator
MSTQIAVRLSDDELAELDWVVVRGEFESRAEAVRAAVASFAESVRQRELDRLIVAGYGATPLGPADLTDAERSTRAGIADEPWQPWW